MKKIYFILSFWLYLVTSFAQNNTLDLQIDDINSLDGKIMIAIFDNELDFKAKQNPVFADTIDTENLSVNAIFNGIPKGIYAIAIYHDENADGHLNTARFGIPSEGVGFSGNLKSIRKPPKFSECSFIISSDTSILINMHYKSKP